MVGVYIGFFVLCLVGGFSIYLLILQRFLAYEVAQQQGHKVFFVLSLILAVVLFYAIFWLLMYALTSLLEIDSGDVLVGVMMVLSGLFSGLLSVLFWKRILRRRTN